MSIIDRKTLAVTLKPFEWQGQTLRVVGTHKVGRKFEHDIKNETTGEFKRKPHSWLEQVNFKMSETEDSL